MATLRDMTAQQKQAAELLATIKGLKRPGAERKERPAAVTPPGDKPQTPRDAYEAISATYWAERRPAPMDLILDQYWRERESDLSKRPGVVEGEEDDQASRP